MTSWLLYSCWVAGSAALLFSVRDTIWIVTGVGKRIASWYAGWKQRNKNVLQESHMAIPHTSEYVIPNPGSTIVTRTFKSIGFILLGVVIGWQYRDHQLLNNTLTYRNVRVEQRITDREWIMQPAGMRPYDFNFCHPITPPAEYVDLKFEQRNGCKQITGVGYLEIAKENNYVAISNGRNSPAPAADSASWHGASTTARAESYGVSAAYGSR